VKTQRGMRRGVHVFRVRLDRVGWGTSVGIVAKSSTNVIPNKILQLFQDGSVGIMLGDSTCGGWLPVEHDSTRVVLRDEGRVKFCLKNGDIISVVFDVDRGLLSFFVNGYHSVCLANIRTTEPWHFALHVRLSPVLPASMMRHRFTVLENHSTCSRSLLRASMHYSGATSPRVPLTDSNSRLLSSPFSWLHIDKSSLSFDDNNTETIYLRNVSDSKVFFYVALPTSLLAAGTQGVLQPAGVADVQVSLSHHPKTDIRKTGKIRIYSSIVSDGFLVDTIPYLDYFDIVGPSQTCSQAIHCHRSRQSRTHKSFFPF